ncbi:MAG: hypothetical protein WKF34_02010 [Pyrinomonadaceae bacterium]
MQADVLSEIVKTYRKHGWVLRRILMTDTARDGLKSFGVPVMDSKIDAAWFARPRCDQAVAWELRYIGGTPLAFLEFLNEMSPGFETSLRAVEQRLTETVAAKQSA